MRAIFSNDMRGAVPARCPMQVGPAERSAGKQRAFGRFTADRGAALLYRDAIP